MDLAHYDIRFRYVPQLRLAIASRSVWCEAKNVHDVLLIRHLKFDEGVFGNYWIALKELVLSTNLQ